MTDNWTALVTEGLVAVLLAVTIAYCIILDRRLRALKADRAALQGIVAEMVTATNSAERAIGTLKQAVAECNDELTDKVARGTQLREDLATQIFAAKEVMRRLAQGAMPPKPIHVPAPVPAPAEVLPPVPAPAPVIAVAAPSEPPPRIADTVAAARLLAQRFQDRVQGIAA